MRWVFRLTKCINVRCLKGDRELKRKLTNQYNYQINQLCYKGEKVIDSESFMDLKYLIKDGHIVLMSGKSGNFAVRIEAIKDLFDELQDVADFWGDIKTKKCLV